MKIFFKKNFKIILLLGALMILGYAVYSSVFAYTYESLDFKYGKVTTSCLNIRCGPGKTYNKVGKIYKDEYINVFAKVGEWYIIQTNSDIIGAVNSNYIEAVYDENEVQEATFSDSKTKEMVINEEIAVNADVLQKEEINGELTEEEKNFLELINANRINNGLGKLEIDNEMQNVARLKAQDLNKENYFAHNSPTYGNIESMFKTFGIEVTSSGENIAGNKTVVGAVEAWMNSESHRKNILSTEFNYTGVAIVENSNYGKIFVQVFAKK